MIRSLDLIKDIMNLKNSDLIFGKRFDASLVDASDRVIEQKNYARVVELADTLDLGSSAERCAGSSPVPGTMLPKATPRTRLTTAALCRSL